MGGKTRTSGQGRPKGVPNKINRELKEMILQALNEQPGGGVSYLKLQASENPSAFMTLLGKVLPMTVAGDPDNPVNVDHSITVSFVKPSE